MTDETITDEQRGRTRDKVQHYRKRMRDERAGRLAAEAEVERLRAENDRARALLSEIVDDDPCWFDHNGDCQAHGWMISTPGGLCGHERAKRFLRAALAAAAVPTQDEPKVCEHGETGPHDYQAPPPITGNDIWRCPGPVAASLPAPTEPKETK